jgi:hypothetical protein
LAEGFDVVIVPDFDGPRAYDFELRTLFFLASWMENAGTSGSYPLHLACIGPPPPSVVWMAERCGARISVHPPLLLLEKRYSNKIRGLEVEGLRPQLLLLDVDTLVFSDLAGLDRLGRCIAAAPAFQPQVPERDWGTIFGRLAIPEPRGRVDSIRGELDLPPILRPLYPRQHAERNHMLPYYNSGVLYLPWNSGIRSLWERRILDAASLFRPGDDAWYAVGQGDQVGLALALSAVTGDGLPLRRLPASYHSQWMYLYRGTLPLDGTKIYHATRFLVNVVQGSDDVPREIVRYRNALLRRFAREFAMESLAKVPRLRLPPGVLPPFRRILDLVSRLWSLHLGHVRGALTHGGAASAASRFLK